MVNKMKVLTAGVKSSSNKKSKKKKSTNNNTKQQSHSTTNDANNNDIESAAAVDSSTTNTVDNRLNTPVNDNINGGHSIVGKFFDILMFCFYQPQNCM